MRRARVQHSGRHYVLVPSGLSKRLLNTLVSLSLPRRPGLRRASDRHFLNLPAGPLLTGEGLCRVGRVPEDAQNWFVGSADIKDASHQMRIPGRLQAFFALLEILCLFRSDWSLRWLDVCICADA